MADIIRRMKENKLKAFNSINIIKSQSKRNVIN